MNDSAQQNLNAASGQAPAPDFSRLLSQRAQAIQSSAIREILKVTERPEVISFAGGLPSPLTFPTEAMRAALDRVLAAIGREEAVAVDVEG